MQRKDMDAFKGRKASLNEFWKEEPLPNRGDEKLLRLSMSAEVLLRMTRVLWKMSYQALTMVIRSRRVQPSSTLDRCSRFQGGVIVKQSDARRISTIPVYVHYSNLIWENRHPLSWTPSLMKLHQRASNQKSIWMKGRTVFVFPSAVQLRRGLVEFIATMPNREQQNYEDTKSFLEYYSDQGIKLAKLGYTCLILNEALGLCVPSQPWCIDTSGEGLQYQCMATLSLDAAIKAHFSLLAMKSRNSLNSETPKTFLSKYDSDLIMSRTLQNVVSFLQYLIPNRNALNVAHENQAKKFIDDLQTMIVIQLHDFPIDQHALEMFRPRQ
ncbi:hypothetical protein EV368DRAFT_67670 [Lentinula lateritia]|nr:hypothetical protein EV368DRAFT_67670 [Lentinula lateritia]